MGSSFKGKRKISRGYPLDSSESDSFVRRIKNQMKEGGSEPLVIVFDSSSAGPRIADGREAEVYKKITEKAKAVDPRRKEAGQLEAEGDDLQDEELLNKAAKIFHTLGYPDSEQRCLEKAEHFAYLRACEEDDDDD